MNNLKKIKKILIDIILYFLLTPASLIFLIYRKRGVKNAPITTKMLKKIGIFPIIDHYYDPQFKFSSDEIASLNIKRNLPAINFNINFQLDFLNSLKYSNELVALELFNKTNNSNFNIDNGSFEAGDADFYYQIIRYLKPKKIIEVGSGHSTKLAHILLDLMVIF